MHNCYYFTMTSSRWVSLFAVYCCFYIIIIIIYIYLLCLWIYHLCIHIIYIRMHLCISTMSRLLWNYCLLLCFECCMNMRVWQFYQWNGKFMQVSRAKTELITFHIYFELQQNSVRFGLRTVCPFTFLLYQCIKFEQKNAKNHSQTINTVQNSCAINFFIFVCSSLLLLLQ